MKDNIKLLKELDKTIKIDFQNNSKELLFNSDKEQLNRVFFNLIKNSIESIQQKTEKVSKNMDEQYAEFLKRAASQAFAGKVIRAFYDQENKMQHSGKTLIAAEVGKELGITNPDGTQPRSDREMLGGPKDFNEAVVY